MLNIDKLGDFEKRLRWVVENPPRDAERWQISPEMAHIMLTWNDRNRPLSESTTRKYAALMREGRWHYTGEPVIFSTERLIDGQHRLAACAISGVTIEALVVFGAPDEAFAFIDVGKTRTAANIFAINGVKNDILMAAAVPWIIGYEKGCMEAVEKRSMGDHEILYQHYLQHTGLQDSTWVARLFSKGKLASPSTMMALHYICAQKDQSDADSFFTRVGEGVGISNKKDPAHKLRECLLQNSHARDKLSRTVIAAYTIKAWNAMRRGLDMGNLKYRQDETFPKVI